MAIKESSKATPGYFLQIIACSAEGPEKMYPLLRSLAKQLGPDARALLLCGTQAGGQEEDFGPFVEVRVNPEESAVGIRALSFSHAGAVEWIVVLEDHNLVGPDWVRALTGELRQVPEDTNCVVGATENLTSTEKWSWANFLNVQIFHWVPKMVEPVQPLSFNVAYRRKLLPDHALNPGEFEVSFAPVFMEKAVGSKAFPIDHVQRRYFPSILYYHFCNGRVAGATIRDYHPDGLRHVLRHARHNFGKRRREVRRLIQAHPRYNELPTATCYRVSVLALVHSVGAIAGGLFGAGRAAWELE